MKDDLERRAREQDMLRVLAVQGGHAQAALESASKAGASADEAIAKAEAALRARGMALPPRPSVKASGPMEMPATRPWDEIIAEARAARPGEMSFDDILTPEQQAAVKARLDGWGAEFEAPHKLTAYDYSVAGVAGVLAGLADVFLVQVPRHPGFLGSEASEGGWLSNLMKDAFGSILPQDKISVLENAYKVPYDVSRNGILDEAVAGLGPRTHRLHSLGHDPILGWIFGVWDILNGSMSTIGKDGSVLIQNVPGAEPVQLGVDIFMRIIEALQSVAGHMASDVATSAGLPPPLFALTQFLQFGDFKGRNMAELSQAMYRSGYDFRHFLSGGVCVALIEVIVRIAYFARELQEGKDFMAALPFGDNPRLRTGLLLAHTTAAAINAGKVAITKNPLSVNYAQWLAFFRYLLPQMHWLLVGKANARRRFMQGKLDDGWRDLDQSFKAEFNLLPAAGIVL